jgi:hypothetical protein
VISGHIERYVWQAEAVFHEIESDTVHIDIHRVRSEAEKPFNILVTSGISDLPIKVLPDANVPICKNGMRMKLHNGSKMLFDKLDECVITDFIDLPRTNVARGNFG